MSRLQPPKLHIVSFDVPYPADYGGAIDVFYKIKALAAAGAEIYLHCFQYGRPEAEELRQYCKRVWYYPRHTGLRGISWQYPYIVYSRRSTELLKKLQEIDAPILFEGVHTTWYLSHPSLRERFKIIRNHNIEFDYYRQLSQKETGFLKAEYYKIEAKFLNSYEHRLKPAQLFAPLSLADSRFFQKLYPNSQHDFIAPFHPYDNVSTLPGSGTYALYHGNLSHPENEEAALFLLRGIFPQLDYPLIIAGRNPTEAITEACKKYAHVTLIANPPAGEMEKLIKEAHIHTLPTFQPTGMKLKLLYALFAGRHVIVNGKMLHGTGLEQCCTVANSKGEFRDKILSLANIPFTEKDIAARSAMLMEHYDNGKNAQRLLKHLPH